jgi:hypothetical protein
MSVTPIMMIKKNKFMVVVVEEEIDFSLCKHPHPTAKSLVMLKAAKTALKA